jgi:hypothetical protein
MEKQNKYLVGFTASSAEVIVFGSGTTYEAKKLFSQCGEYFDISKGAEL